ncbi:hypothetical protein GCM10027321_23160 [Massilia terrae]|uniref:histidine kinase n=1 Tax=Massilia terrae TaxID=1811224 RepID=A0ABT2CXB2_9BURK|nr:ATP-binding protein [Massilia terrae]MCS0658623.1 response regulator [Massilia terrae]
MRIRTRLLILVLSVLVPSFIAAGLAILFVFEEQRQAQASSVAETTRAFALLVDSELQSKAALLRALAAAPALARTDLAEFYVHARQVTPTSDEAVVLFSLEGRQLLNTRLPLGSPLPLRHYSNLADLMRESGDEDALVSDLFLAPVTHKHEFSIQVPVTDGVQVRYHLALGLDAGMMERLITRQHLRDDPVITILDRNGMVVARSVNGARYTGTLARERTRRAVRAATEGSYDIVNMENVPVQVFFNTVPSSGWKVLISVPKRDIQRAPAHAAAMLGVAMAVLLALGTLAARWLSNRALEPIDYLGRAARKLGQGEELLHEPQGLPEIDTVAQQMAHASTLIRHAKHDLEQRVAEAVAATEHAQGALLKSQKLEALGRLTGGIAHEFNNLLQTLTTALQAIELMSTQAPIKNLVQTSMRTVRRAAALTGQLGSFGRLQEARLVTIDVEAQIGSAAQLIQGALGPGIRLEVACAPGLWPVTTEPLQFDLALLNLAINARDAMPGGGLLRIEAQNVAPFDGAGRGEVRIRVADSGAGMAPEVLARALDPFFTTKPQGQGSGLGLAQAYAFATQSQGRLQLDSAPGAGTRVDIFLPRALDAVAPRQADDAHAVPAKGGGTVLFVEDDPLVREAVAPALRSCGFEVLVAEDGDTALRMLEQGARPDVVFSDIVMPGTVGGIELAGIVRERFPGLRVVLASGYTERQAAIPGVRVLAKPYAIEQVVELLR